MPVHYFLPVPKLPHEVRDQSGAVELVSWLVDERTFVTRGQAVARVQTWWALLELLATGDAMLGKQILDPGTSVREGDPIAVMYADGESVPYDRAKSELRVCEILKPKPTRTDKSRDNAT